MKKTFIFSYGVNPLSEADRSALNTLPSSISANQYNFEDDSLISTLYARYIDPIKPLMYVSYSKKSSPYMTTNRQPTYLQSKHHILLWFAHFCKLGDLTDSEAADLFFSEMTTASEERIELLTKMYVRGSDLIKPQKPRPNPIPYPKDKL